jgi:hypothetical protein
MPASLGFFFAAREQYDRAGGGPSAEGELGSCGEWNPPRGPRDGSRCQNFGRIFSHLAWPKKDYKPAP